MVSRDLTRALNDQYPNEPETQAYLGRLNALELSRGQYEYGTSRLLDLIQRALDIEPDVGSAAAVARRPPKAPAQQARPQQKTGEQIKREADSAAPSVAEAQVQSPQLRRSKIFLCYRREDTQGFAGRIYDSLVGKYGHEQVFRDIDSIPAGVRYSVWIQSMVGQCGVMIVLIGDAWLSAQDRTGQRRLDLPKDLVRQEIEAALRGDIPIIPVRLQGAPMPSEDELPPSIADFTSFNSAEVTDSRWVFDVGRLIQAIDDLIVSG